jgi:DNA-binding beta-propeller fold protein YncE
MPGERLAVTDVKDHVVRIINTKDLSSITIGGLQGFKGWVDGLQPQVVRFDNPNGIAVTSNGGKLVVVDQGSNRIRVIEKLCAPYHIVVEGRCLPCDSIPCGLGSYRTACRTMQTDGVCVACPYPLPANAVWDSNQPNCTWSCKSDFKISGSSLSQTCVQSGTPSKRFQLSEPVLIGELFDFQCLGYIFVLIAVSVSFCPTAIEINLDRSHMRLNAQVFRVHGTGS